MAGHFTFGVDVEVTAQNLSSLVAQVNSQLAKIHAPEQPAAQRDTNQQVYRTQRLEGERRVAEALQAGRINIAEANLAKTNWTTEFSAMEKAATGEVKKFLRNVQKEAEATRVHVPKLEEFRTRRLDAEVGIRRKIDLGELDKDGQKAAYSKARGEWKDLAQGEGAYVKSLYKEVEVEARKFGDHLKKRPKETANTAGAPELSDADRIKQAAAETKEHGEDPKYVEAVKELATQRRKLAQAIGHQLAAETDYTEATARLAEARDLTTIAVLKSQSADIKGRKIVESADHAGKAQASIQADAELQKRLAKIEADASRTQAIRKNEATQAGKGDPKRIEAQAQAKAARQQDQDEIDLRAAKIRLENAPNTAKIKAETKAIQDQERQAIRDLGPPELSDAEKVRHKADTTAAHTQDPVYKSAAEDLAVQQRELAQLIAHGLAGEKAYTDATARLAEARDLTAIATLRAQSTEIKGRKFVEGADSKKKTQAGIQADSALSARLAKIEAEAAQAQALRKQRKTQAGAGDETRIEAEAQTIAARTLDHNKALLRASQISLEHATETAQIKAQIKLLNEQERVAVQRIVNEERKAANNGSQVLSTENTTGFQKLQARLHARTTGEPVDADSFQKMGQFVTSRALTTAGFAVAGGAFYGATQAIGNLVHEATELDRIFSTIQAQFRSVDQAAQFPQFRASMLDISRETGVSASEVATVGFQMKGAFGGTADSIERTRDAIKASVVTGLPIAELTDSLTGAAISFGVSISDITDESVHLEEQFGVLSKESIKVFGDMAATANEAGLSLKELGAIVGEVQKNSGRSGSSIAEAFGRILPAIGQSSGDVIGLYEQLNQRDPEKFGASTRAMEENVAKGDTGKVLTQLIRDWDKLDTTTQQYVVTLLGGRREAATLIPLFKDTSEVIAEFDRTQSIAGKGAVRFADVQKTLQVRLDQLRQSFVQMGDSLARLGLLDVAKVGAGAVLELFKALGFVLRELADLNTATDGWIGKLIGVSVAIQTLRVSLIALAGARGAVAVVTGAAAAGPAAAATGGGLGSQVLLGGVGAAAAQRTASTATTASAPLWQKALGSFATPGSAGVLGARLGTLSAGATAAVAGVATLTLALGALAIWAYDIKKISDIRTDHKNQDQATRDAYTNGTTLKTQEYAVYGEANGPSKKKGFYDYSAENPVPDEGAAQKAAEDAAHRAEVLAPELARNTQERFQAAMDSGVVKGPEAQKLLDAMRAGKGTKETGMDARKILFGLNKEQDSAVDAYLDDRKSIEELINSSGEVAIQKLAVLQSGRQSGRVSRADYVKTLKAELVGTDRALAEHPGDDQLKQVSDQIHGFWTAEITDQMQELFKNIELVRQMGSIDPNALALIGQAEAVLADPSIRGGEGARAAAQLVIAQKNQFIKDAITNAPNAAAALAASRQELPLAESTRRAAAGLSPVAGPTPSGVFGRISKRVQDALLGTVPGVVKQSPQEQNAQIEAQSQVSQLQARLAASGPGSQNAVAQAALARKVAKLQADAAGAMTDSVQKQTAGLNAQVAAAEAENQAQQANYAVQQAKLAFQLQQVAGDPVATAALQAQAAAAQIADARAHGDDAGVFAGRGAAAAAEQAQRQAQDEIAQAQLGVLAAMHPNNAIEQASIAQRRADGQAKSAVGVAAKLNAEAARIAADRAMDDAMVALTDSRIAVLQAMASSISDVVGVADLGLRKSQDALSRLLKDDPTNDTLINQARAQVINDEANVRSTTLSHERELAQFDYDMGRITREQLVAKLRAFEVLANPEEMRDIERAIRQLQQEASADFQFNLPTNLDLPTLYDARRLSQSSQYGTDGFTAGGGSFADNRVITIELNASNAVDGEAAVATIVAALNEAPRFGTQPRMY